MSTVKYRRARRVATIAVAVAALVASLGLSSAAFADTDAPSGQPVPIDDGLGRGQKALTREQPLSALQAAGVPSLAANEMFGVDIATSQTNIDLQAFAASGGQFAIIKMGGGNAADSPYVAPAYRTQLSRARAAGLHVGHYWMNGDRNGLTPAAAADYFVGHSDIQVGDVVALDIEAIDGVAAYTPAQAYQWIQRVRITYPGLKVLLYLNQSAANNQDWSQLIADGNPLWVAVWGANNGQPGARPQVRGWNDWAMWQYSSRGSVAGFAGAIDVDIAKSDVFSRYGWTPVDRLAGSDRFATAVAVSTRAFPSGGANVAYIASAISAPDALSATPAAAKEGGPVLLTYPDRVPDAVMTELRRLAPKKIKIVGGVQAVSTAAAAQLSAVAPVERYAGDDRFATSRAVAAAVFPKAGEAFVATGLDFADALTGSAAIAAAGPMLLVDGQAATADAATLATLKSASIGKVYVAGGTSSVSPGIQASLAAQIGIDHVTRLAGSDRFETAAAINAEFFKNTSPARIYLATGIDFADALTGGALAASQSAPLYLSRPNCIPGTTYDVLRYYPAKVVLLGGVNALNDSVARLTSC